MPVLRNICGTAIVPLYCTLCYLRIYYQTSVQYSDTAMNCINAANKVFGIDNTCTDGFIDIMEANSIGSVAVAAQEICTVQQCRDRLTDFVNYLTACDGLDDNEVRLVPST